MSEDLSSLSLRDDVNINQENIATLRSMVVELEIQMEDLRRKMHDLTHTMQIMTSSVVTLMQESNDDRTSEL